MMLSEFCEPESKMSHQCPKKLQLPNLQRQTGHSGSNFQASSSRIFLLSFSNNDLPHSIAGCKVFRSWNSLGNHDRSAQMRHKACLFQNLNCHSQTGWSCNYSYFHFQVGSFCWCEVVKNPPKERRHLLFSLRRFYCSSEQTDQVSLFVKHIPETRKSSWIVMGRDQFLYRSVT